MLDKNYIVLCFSLQRRGYVSYRTCDAVYCPCLTHLFVFLSELLESEEALASLLEQVNRTKRHVQTNRLKQVPSSASSKQKRAGVQSSRFNTLSSSSIAKGERTDNTRRRRISYSRHEEEEEEDSSPEEKETASDSDFPGDDSPTLAFVEEPTERSQESEDTIGNRLLRRRWNEEKEHEEKAGAESKGESSEDSVDHAPVRRRRQARHTTSGVR